MTDASMQVLTVTLNMGKFTSMKMSHFITIAQGTSHTTSRASFGTETMKGSRLDNSNGEKLICI